MEVLRRRAILQIGAAQQGCVRKEKDATDCTHADIRCKGRRVTLVKCTHKIRVQRGHSIHSNGGRKR